MHIRRTLALGAVSAVALTGLASTPASADNHVTGVDCTTVDTAIDTATDAYAAAKEAWKDSQKPLGQLIKAQREEAGAEARESRHALRDVRQTMKTADRAERRELLEQRTTERKQLAKASRQLESRQALLEQIKADRALARQSWYAARLAVAELTEYRATNCEDEAAETDDTEVEETDDTEVEETDDTEVEEADEA